MITRQLSIDGKTVCISPSGKFDLNAVGEFNKAWVSYPRGEKFYVVDLEHVDYIDSSAIGSLLQLLDHSNIKKQVELVNASDNVREALLIASLDKLFVIK